MSVDPRDLEDGAATAPLTARAAAAWKRAPELRAAAIDDYLLPPAARLDERDRAAIDATLARCTGAVERAILNYAARILRDRPDAALADALVAPAPPAALRLRDSTLVRDADFMREIIGRSRLAVLAAALPLGPQDQARPSLLPRLGDDPDPAVAAAARAMLAVADRLAPFDEAADSGTGLPAELHHRLTWWVAAVIRERTAVPGEALDTILAEAALRSLGDHDEGERPEAAATRLAALLNTRALPSLLVEALGDRQLQLFVALLARGTEVSHEDARDAALDPAGDRLWTMLRALDCPREDIARIGLALGQADGRRDLDAFADALDGIAATAPEDARAALAPVRES